MNHKSNMDAFNTLQFLSRSSISSSTTAVPFANPPRFKQGPGGFYVVVTTSVGPSTTRKEKQHSTSTAAELWGLRHLEEESVAVDHVKSYDITLPLGQKSNTLHPHLLSRPISIRLPPNYLEKKNQERYSSSQSWYSVNLTVSHK